MYVQLHDRFQSFLDNLLSQDLKTNDLKQQIKAHLLSHQYEYQEMLLHFFKDEQLTKDNYFYITYTYQDRPIDLNRQKEVVVSFLYDLDIGMHFELVIFNDEYIGSEDKEIFYVGSDFYS